jgi:hypothetical protein
MLNAQCYMKKHQSFDLVEFSVKDGLTAEYTEKTQRARVVRNRTSSVPSASTLFPLRLNGLLKMHPSGLR